MTEQQPQDQPEDDAAPVRRQSAVRAEAQRANIANARRYRQPPGPIRHGTTRYMAARCRGENGHPCVPCLAVGAADIAAHRAKVAAATARLAAETAARDATPEQLAAAAQVVADPGAHRPGDVEAATALLAARADLDTREHR